MATGKVKWFNNAKGYGFILPADGGGDLFVHYSSILMDGYKTLKAGQDVEFDMLEGPKGMHAVNIRPVNPLLVDGMAAPTGQTGYDGDGQRSGSEAPAEASTVNGTSRSTS